MTRRRRGVFAARERRGESARKRHRSIGGEESSRFLRAGGAQREQDRVTPSNCPESTCSIEVRTGPPFALVGYSYDWHAQELELQNYLRLPAPCGTASIRTAGTRSGLSATTPGGGPGHRHPAGLLRLRIAHRCHERPHHGNAAGRAGSVVLSHLHHAQEPSDHPRPSAGTDLYPRFREGTIFPERSAVRIDHLPRSCAQQAFSGIGGGGSGGGVGLSPAAGVEQERSRLDADRSGDWTVAWLRKSVQPLRKRGCRSEIPALSDGSLWRSANGAGGVQRRRRKRGALRRHPPVPRNS